MANKKKTLKKSTVKKPVVSKSRPKVTKKLNKKGLGNRTLILIAALITVLTAISFYLWQRQKNNELSASAAYGCVTTSYSKGTSGDCVRAIQSIIKKKSSYYPYTVDGIYGTNTVNAVTSWQKNIMRITPTGTVGSATWSSLCSTVSGTKADLDYQTAWCSSLEQSYCKYQWFAPARSQSKYCVRHLASMLSYLVSGVTNFSGTYDGNIQSSVTNYQKSKGLTADGVAGTATNGSICTAIYLKFGGSWISTDPQYKAYYGYNCDR